MTCTVTSDTILLFSNSNINYLVGKWVILHKRA